MNPCQGPPHRSRVNGAQHRGRRKEKLQPHIGFSTVTVPRLAANGAVNKHSRSHAPSSPGVPNAGFVTHRQRDLGKSPYWFPTAAVTMLQKLEFMAREFCGPAENEVPAGPRASPPAPGATPGLSRSRSSAFWALQTRHSSHLAAFLLRLDWRPHWPCGLAQFPL